MTNRTNDLTTDLRQVRSYTNRARTALRDLPTLLLTTGFLIERTEDQEQAIRDCINEAVGALVGIADTLGVEL